MRFFFFTLFLLSLAPQLYGQNQRIQQLEQAITRQNGRATIDQSLELAELYYESGQYNKATRSAIQAFSDAQRINDKERMAQALQIEGKVIMKVPKLPKRVRKRAFAQLEKKMKLLEDSPNKELKKENIEMLRQMAEEEGMDKEVQKLDQMLLELEEDRANLPVVEKEPIQPTTPPPPIGNNFRKKRDFWEEFKDRKAELDKELDELNMANEALEAELLYKEQAIQEMNAEQIKKELMFSEQANILANQRIKLDSLNNQKLQDSLLLVEAEMQTQKVEALAEKQRNQRNLFILVAFLVLILALGYYSRFRSIRKTNKLLEEKNNEIAREKHRAEELLLNILPVKVAEELKLKGKATTRYYSNATVLFTDFQNFSSLSKNISPAELVDLLDYCYKSFDQIIDQFQLEKIKTIGDAYMCAGGLPEPDPNHTRRVVQAALEIQKFLDSWKLERISLNAPIFEARVGIHTGPVIAGVVGSKKFAYDIWGDTVNIASRMESNGAKGKVNISGQTYEIIQEYFQCDHRGKIPTKNIGEVDMYFVLGEI